MRPTYFSFKQIKNNFIFVTVKKRPSRSDLIVLVAHNDDPTGIK